MSENRRSPAASLGLLDATMIGIGAMIGAGIFVLTGLAADIAGPAAILVFAFNGVGTLFTGLSYAELASAVPKSGGGYAFVREVFSDPVAFIMGWMLSFAYMIAAALYGLGFGSNFVEFLHLYLPSAPATPVVYGLGAVVVFVALNVVSTEASGGAETIVTALKVVILLVFVAFGLSVVDAGQFDPLFPAGESPAVVLPAMGLTFIAFEGYDLITTVTEEVENPRKNIPRAIFLSLAVTLVVYLLVVFVAIGTLGADKLGAAGETAIAQAAESFMPAVPLLGTGAAIIAFGAVFSTISALNAAVIAASRVVFAMGREGQLPGRFGRISARFGTPMGALLVSAVVILVSVAFLPTERVGRVASLFFLLSFVIVNVAVVVLRRRRPNLTRPYEMPLYPAPPVLGIVFNLVLSFFLLREHPGLLVLGGGWVCLGVVVYLGWRSRTGAAADAASESSANRPTGSEP